MKELIMLYLIGGLICSGIIIIWNFSYISIHLLGRFYKNKEIDSVDDLADCIAEKHPTFSEFIFCPLCVGFWLCAVVASLIFYLNNLSVWFIPACAFSWPLMIFFFFKYFDNE